MAPARAARVGTMAALVLLPLAIASTMAHLAYTEALLAFVLPLALAGHDLRRADADGAWRRALVPAVAFLVLTGWLLGFAFGGRFFRYPTPAAVLGVGLMAPGDAGARFVPIEEFAFYALGFPFMAVLYAWAAALWPRPSPPTPRGAWRAMLWALPGAAVAALFGLAPGRPGYAIFLGLVYVPAFSGLALRLGRVVRFDAFAVSLGLTLVLASVWEAVLAVPRGWWGYEPSHLLGVWVAPGLPVEAVIVWFLGPIGSSLTTQACRAAR